MRDVRMLCRQPFQSRQDAGQWPGISLNDIADHWQTITRIARRITICINRGGRTGAFNPVKNMLHHRFAAKRQLIFIAATHPS